MTTEDPGARPDNARVPSGQDRTITRRQVLAGAGAVLGAAAIGAPRAAAAAVPALPDPKHSGIDHVVVCMMENRSFDHFWGWLPGADGQQQGLSYVDNDGNSHPTHHLRTHQGCAHPDPDHSFDGGRVEFNNGACDGWLRAGDNDEFSIGYYTAADFRFFRKAVPYWTACDRYFAAIMAETYPNRFYQHSAQTDRIYNSGDTCELPTIWDSLADAGLTGNYYYTDIPFVALWGGKYQDISQPFSQFVDDAAAGKLPAVSFVDPKFYNEGSGTSGDDHPHADIRVGQYFLNQVYEAVVTSPNWARTMLVINYDEWGGFFDHVAPRVAPDQHPEWGLRGFRVPCLVVSPRARRHHVAHGVFDHTSILSMIEWRWGLDPLTVRDAKANNIACVLDFDNPPNLDAPMYDVPPFVGQACPAGSPSGGYEEWGALRAKAIADGWRLPTRLVLRST